MNKDQKMLILIIIVILLIASSFGVYAFLKKDEKVCKSEETDAIKFKREYEEYNDKEYDNGEPYFNVQLSNKNHFKYVSEKDAVKFLKEGTGVIYFGFPQCPWCRSLVPYLEELATENNVKEILYLNIIDIRDSYKVENGEVVTDKKGTDSYYEILKALDEYLQKFEVNDEKGKSYDTKVKRLYAPTTVAVKNGKIVSFHEGTVETQKKFVSLTDEEITELKSIISNIYSTVYGTVCSTDSGC